MSFLSTLALAVAFLVVAPYLAHRLRRRRAEEQPFPPARLVEPAPPQARRRSRLEDRALLTTRTAAVVALAVLGATPFVRCSRLSLQRASGASVAMAIVIDDSMSMRADAGGKTRFDRARDGARDLLGSAREGDAAAIVLAGQPARVALAATTDLSAVRGVLDALAPSDRATDLDGAIDLARGLVASLPQVDRRIVLLSDLADGRPAAPTLGADTSVPLWIALPDLAGAKDDCAVMRAERSGASVRVSIACSPSTAPASREVVVEDAAGKVLGRAQAPGGATSDVSVVLPSDAGRASRARLVIEDAIAADDSAPIVSEAARGVIAVVADATDEAVATGGAPIAEQALSALRLDLEVRPLPALPDRAEDLSGETGYLGVLLDDPPGFTPEQRHALGAFLDGGGVALIALGPHAASAPLGATLEPVLGHAVGWTDTTQSGADTTNAASLLTEAAAGLTDLGASRRAVITPEDAASLDVLVRWSDGAPLVARRTLGRGEAWLVTLPFSVDASDVTLHPGFLAMLDAWVRTAREHAAPKRSPVGAVWRLTGSRSVEVEGPAGPVTVTRDADGAHVAASLIGAYVITVDGKTETRVAAPDRREIDLRPRTVAARATGEELGERRAAVDMSGPVALVVLGLVALEMALRAWSRWRLREARGR